jgi:hypothetical protein
MDLTQLTLVEPFKRAQAAAATLPAAAPVINVKFVNAEQPIISASAAPIMLEHSPGAPK